MDEFVKAVLEPDSDYSRKLISLIPLQYHVSDKNIYSKLQSVLDFISGMTDLYALKLYKDIKGYSHF